MRAPRCPGQSAPMGQSVPMLQSVKCWALRRCHCLVLAGLELRALQRAQFWRLRLEWCAAGFCRELWQARLLIVVSEPDLAMQLPSGLGLGQGSGLDAGLRRRGSRDRPDRARVCWKWDSVRADENRWQTEPLPHR